MSDYATPGAASGDTGSAGGAALRKPVRLAARSGLIERIVRRWWLIVAAMALAVVVALVYLAVATPLYTVTSVLSLDHRIGNGGAGDLPPDEFLKAQQELILSTPVLSTAIDSIDITQRAKLVGFAHSPNALHDALHVRTSLGEQVIVITLEAPEAQSAARVVNAVTEAYLKARGEHQTGTAGGLADLTRQTDARVAERAAAEKALTDYRASANLAGNDADRAALDQLNQLNNALTAAQVELADANASIQASREMLEDPPKRDEVIEANRSKGIFGGLDQQRSQIENELSKLEPLLERQRQTMSPQHPVLSATIMKVENLKQKRDALEKQYVDTYRAYLEQQRLTSQKKIDNLKTLIADKSVANQDYAAKAAKLAELEANLKRADAALAEADAKLNQIKVTSDTGPRVGVALAAMAPSRPTHPDRVMTLAWALAAGLVGGLLLAAVGRSSR